MVYRFHYRELNILSSSNEKPFGDSHQREKSIRIVLLFINYVSGVRSVEQQLGLERKGRGDEAWFSRFL